MALYEQLRDKHEILPFMPESLDAFYKEKLPGLTTYPIPHFVLAKVGDRIDYPQTLQLNKEAIALFRVRVRKVARRLRRSGAEAVISDFEPYVPAAARLVGLPILQINHPGIICRYDHQSFAAYSSRWVARKMMGPFDKRIVCSFYNGTVGPIIREEIVRARRRAGDFFVVYLRGAYAPLVLRHLERFPDLSYKVFPSKTMDFVTELASCKGIIANGGHQLMCESVYLNKPMFVLPQKGQYEQWLNAEMLERSGWGMRGSMKAFEERLSRFIRDIDSFPRSPRFDGLTRVCFENELEKTVSLINDWLVANSTTNLVNN